MIVLGIDPGTAALGYGILDRTGARLRAIDYGTLVTSPQRPLPERLREVHRCVTELIELHRPSILAVERLFFSRNVQTAFAVGQARGVVLLAAAEGGLEVREATPSEVKVAVTGYGAANKEQVARMVAVVLGLPEPPVEDDAADALAVAICIAHRQAGGVGSRSAVLDRAAVAPIEDSGVTPYERAVRDALTREKPARRKRARAS